MPLLRLAKSLGHRAIGQLVLHKHHAHTITKEEANRYSKSKGVKGSLRGCPPLASGTCESSAVVGCDPRVWQNIYLVV